VPLNVFYVLVPQFSISRALRVSYSRLEKNGEGRWKNHYQSVAFSLTLIANIFHLLLVKDSTGVSSISLLGDMQIKSILIFSRRPVRVRSLAEKERMCARRVGPKDKWHSARPHWREQSSRGSRCSCCARCLRNKPNISQDRWVSHTGKLIWLRAWKAQIGTPTQTHAAGGSSFCPRWMENWPKWPAAVNLTLTTRACRVGLP
jgi:hypothetical protein